MTKVQFKKVYQSFLKACFKTQIGQQTADQLPFITDSKLKFSAIAKQLVSQFTFLSSGLELGVGNG